MKRNTIRERTEMFNVFELSSSYYEDFTSELFTHPAKSKRQFEEDVKLLIKKHFKDYVDYEQSWCGTSGLIQFIGMQLPSLGYAPIERQKVNFFGSSIFDKKDSENEIKDIVGEDFQSALDKNANLLESLLKK